MIKKTIPILFVVALLGVCVLSYINIKRQSTFEQHNIFNVVGSKAAFYIRANNPAHISADNNENSDFFKLVYGNDKFLIPLIQNILSDAADTGFVMHHNSAYVLTSAYANKKYLFDYIHFIPTRNDVDIDRIAKKISDTSAFNKQISCYQLNNSKFYIHNFDDIIAVSSSLSALVNNLEQINDKQTLAQDALFTDGINSAGRYADANIFINALQFADIIKVILGSEIADSHSDFIKNSARWFILDADITQNLCNLSGLIYVNSQNFLNILNTQQKSDFETLKSLSPSTLFAYTMQTDNIDSLLHKYNVLFSSTDVSYFDRLAQTGDSLYINIAQFIKQIYPEEITLTYNASQGWVTLLKVANAQNAVDELNKLENKNTFADIIPEVFGKIFAINKGAEVSMVNNFIVIAESKILNLSNQGILSVNSDYIVDESLAAIYANPAGISKFLGIEKTKNKDLFKNIFIEIIPGNNKFYINSNISFDFHNTHTEPVNADAAILQSVDTAENVAVNAVHENTKIILQQTVENIINQEKYTVRQYSDNTIELIDAGSKPLWKQSLSEKIKGNILVIDPLNKNIAYLLFNTENKIFMIDFKGNSKDGFPLALPAAATNSVSAFAYDKTSDFRIFIACTNKKIYLYNTRAEKVSGWKEPRTNGIVQRPVEFLRMNAKDYLVVVDNSKIYVLNRKGYDRTVVKEKVQISPDAEFEKLYSPARLRVKDKQGKQLTINLTNGKITRK